MNIADLLKGVGAAATNPLAFVAYLAALVIWGLLRWRVDRNKNLLARLKDVPARDRATLLRDEMGIWDTGEALNAEQRIRARIYQYYFLAFIVLCGVVVVLFSIARFREKPKVAEDPKTVHRVEVVNTPPDPELLSAIRKIEILDTGVSKSSVIGSFGPPTHEKRMAGKSCIDYTLPFAKMILFFDARGATTFLYVVSTDAGFRPNVLHWGSYDGHPKDSGRLGNFTFSTIDREPLKTAFYNDGGNHFPSIYSEALEYTYSSKRRDYFVWTTDGVTSSEESDKAVHMIFGIERNQGAESENWSSMDAQKRAEFRPIRDALVQMALPFHSLRKNPKEQRTSTKISLTTYKQSARHTDHGPPAASTCFPRRIGRMGKFGNSGWGKALSSP